MRRKKRDSSDFVSRLCGFELFHRLHDDEMSFYKPDTSFVLKTGLFHLLPTLPGCPLSNRNMDFPQHKQIDYAISRVSETRESEETENLFLPLALARYIAASASCITLSATPHCS